MSGRHVGFSIRLRGEENQLTAVALHSDATPFMDSFSTPKSVSDYVLSETIMDYYLRLKM